MDIILDPLIRIVLIALNLYVWVVIVAAVMSWLVAFGVVNSYNRVVYIINDFLYRVTEPALRPLRRIIPNLGGIDITPVVLILIIYFIQMVLERVYVELIR
jgi:YggT family protein